MPEIPHRDICTLPGFLADWLFCLSSELENYRLNLERSKTGIRDISLFPYPLKLKSSVEPSL